jgi:hypothetical protein
LKTTRWSFRTVAGSALGVAYAHDVAALVAPLALPVVIEAKLLGMKF